MTEHMVPVMTVKKTYFDGWAFSALLIALLVLLPIISLIFLSFSSTDQLWPHLMDTSLPRYFKNSVILASSVGFFTAILGTVTAWIISEFRFPGHRILRIMLVLPLAIPSYLGAYAIVDFLEYAGPVQTLLRGMTGWQSSKDYWFPEIRSMKMAILVLTLSLYPYVYLLARHGFSQQPRAMQETARSLGVKPLKRFFTLSLPLVRPAIVAGVSIVMMESLAEFGAVDYFAIQTLTTGIFTVWLEAHNAGGAAQIALSILVMVAFLTLLERHARRNTRLYTSTRGARKIEPRRIKGAKLFWIYVICLTPIILGFIFPVSVISSHGLAHLEAWVSPSFWQAFTNSVMVGLIGAAVTVILALIMLFGIRFSKSKLPNALSPITMIGYAAPGAVLALGLLIPVASFDLAIARVVHDVFGIRIGLLISGSFAILILAYLVRFFALGFGNLDTAYDRIPPSLFYASRSLGKRPAVAVKEIYLPLMQGSIISSALLVFVDITKELPATLLLRPFNYNSLATHVYEQASLENIGQAAPAALAIIIVSLIPILMIERKTTQMQTSING